MAERAAIILAAGVSSRLDAEVPKVLCRAGLLLEFMVMQIDPV